MKKNYPDSKLLEMLADWFDVEHKLGRWKDNDSTEVQDDLRRIAAKLSELEYCEHIEKEHEKELAQGGMQ